MKKKLRVICLFLTIASLSACQWLGQKETDRLNSENMPELVPSSSEEEDYGIDMRDDFETYRPMLMEMLGAEPSQGLISKEQKIPAAKNGVDTYDGLGNLVEPFKVFQVPEDWEYLVIEGMNTKNEPAFQVRNGQPGFGIFQLFMLNSYNKSAMEGGEQLPPEVLVTGLTQLGYEFMAVETLEFDGQSWQVGIEMPNGESENVRFVFFRMERTGSFDDSLILARFEFYGPNLEDIPTETLDAYKASIAEVKEVLLSIKKGEE